MDINCREKGNVVVLDISGDIDIYNAAEIMSTINKFCESKTYNIIINLKEVEYIDSSGLGVLITGLMRLREYKMGMKIINVYDSVKKVFELTNLTSFFDIYDSELEAIRAFEC